MSLRKDTEISKRPKTAKNPICHWFWRHTCAIFDD